MKLPRDLSGADLIKLLCKHHGYRRVNQEGSHVILETDLPRSHRLAVPDPAPTVGIMLDRNILRPVLPEITPERLPHLSALASHEHGAGTIENDSIAGPKITAIRR